MIIKLRPTDLTLHTVYTNLPKRIPHRKNTTN